MARRIYNRQPLSFSTSGKDYAQQSIWSQVQFKGLCDDKNDSTIDQLTFTSVNNMLVDDDGLLISRPPLKREGVKNIVEEWEFGNYVLRLTDEGSNMYKLSCVSHEMIDADTDDKKSSWVIECPNLPVCKCVQIEDKIFVWLDKIFVALNTSSENGKLYFENAEKYIYIPIAKQVINGIESDLEDKNFLTDSYIKRYQYSPLSGVDFQNLYYKPIDVSTNNTSLYSTTLKEKTERGLIYPLLYIGNDYIDIVHTNNTNVIMKYSSATDIIKISFGTNIFKSLPKLDDMISRPILTRDGLSVIAFTTTKVAKCKLVAQDSTDFVMSNVLEWTFENYNRLGQITDPINGIINVPAAYFLTSDIFVYDFTSSTGRTYMYAEFPVGPEQKSITFTSALKLYSNFKIKYTATNNANIVIGDMSSIITGDEKVGYITLEFVKSLDDGTLVNHRAQLKITNMGDYVSHYGFDIADFLVIETEEKSMFTVYFTVAAENTDGNNVFVEYIYTVDYDGEWKNSKFVEGNHNNMTIAPSDDLRINGIDIITKNGFRLDNVESELPANGRLSVYSTDDRYIQNGDYVEIGDITGYIYKITEEHLLNHDTIIKNGDLVVISKYGSSEEDFLMPNNISYNKDKKCLEAESNEYHIRKLDSSGNYVDGVINNNDYVLLESALFEGLMHKSNPGNPYGNFEIVLLQQNISIRDNIKIRRKIEPIFLDGEGIWYRVDDMLWTSLLSIDNTMYLDERINSDVNHNIPTHVNNLGEYYMSFVNNGKNLLEITSTRKDDNQNFLLYLPRINEQEFANEITNIHPLAENMMAIFTEREIWYVSKVTMQDGSVYYTKATRSKIPVGCRQGDNIITMLNGNAIVFPTQRGITAMAPEQFIATNEPTLSYLSDAIQDKYYHFYNDKVKHYDGDYLPNIKICTYRHWMLFYKYMDREVLALDTRSGTWWLWSVPYPIMDITVDSRLHFLLNVQGLYFNNQGMRFLWADKESKMYLDTEGNFPELTDTDFVYKDDILSESLNGNYVEYYENEYVGTRKVLKYASPIIKWHFVSPKLHFGAINNYKSIKGITLNVKGKEVMTSKLSTKVFRDITHPENSETMEVNINDLRTFVKPLNLMHVTNFQYRLENDADNDAQHQLKLNILCIKYEVKEKLR